MASVGSEPVHLSTLLDGQANDVALLVALCAMRCWGERGSADTRDPMLAGVRAVDDGTHLKTLKFVVPDLAISRPEPEEATDASR
jgi:hypothetical protein